MDEMKKMDERGYVLPNRRECEQAFDEWLKQKRAEERAEQQETEERTRRLVAEERRARRMQGLMCSVDEDSRFRYLRFHFDGETAL